MALVRLVIQVEEEQREAFRKHCKELGIMQAEVVRSLLRQFIQCNNGHPVVIPGDVAALLLSMDLETMELVVARAKERGQQE